MVELFTITKKTNGNRLKQQLSSFKLTEYRNVIKEFLMFENFKTHSESILDLIPVIKCLAIGNFTYDFPAR